MRPRPLLVTAFVALAAGAAHGWPAAPTDDRPGPTLDQLIDRLAEVRAKETELRGRRADLERQVRDRLADQARRLKQVGVSPGVADSLELPPTGLPSLPPPESDVAPRVITVVPAPVRPVSPPATSRDDFGFPVVGSSLPTTSLPAPVPTGRDRGCQAELPPAAKLEDRLDALGGLPLAYTRWWRDTAPRRAPEVHFYFGSAAGLFGGN